MIDERGRGGHPETYAAIKRMDEIDYHAGLLQRWGVVDDAINAALRRHGVEPDPARKAESLNA